MTNFNGDFINGYTVKEGLIQTRLIKKIQTNSNARIIIIDGVKFDELDEVVVINNYHSGIEQLSILTLYDDSLEGDVGPYDGINWEYNNNSGGGGIPEPVVEEEEDFEDKINDSELDPCPKGIMDELKNSSNVDLATILKKFGTSDYNVKLQMGLTENNNFAETKVISKNNYSITVSNQSFTYATKLFKAAGLLHEMVHAYMLSVVDDYRIYPTTAPFEGFPELFKIYVQKNGSGNTVAAQHEDMANKYVDAIASALEKYHIDSASGPVSLADKQVFADLAWSGLDGTEIFNKKFPEGSPERTRLINRLVSETIGKYSSDAIGRSCE